MSNFMQKQITGFQSWLRVETTQGTEYLDSATLGLFVRNSEQTAQPLTERERTEATRRIMPYTEGLPKSWENVKGYGARLSAPGYLDCTEWLVFDTDEEAKAYLDETFPEDEPEHD
jgi:hypothetical protein